MSVSVDQQASVYEGFLFFFQIFGLGSTAMFEIRSRQLQRQSEWQNEHLHRRFDDAVPALQKAGVNNDGLGGNVCPSTHRARPLHFV
ncbi:hypothetical protein BDN67DRAFT_976192 [Paxillus ammoniavirescens]|nr:hypothetical protein BDN67DRAFT_976192 [Paxillus ammoniavirescens]